MEVQTQQRPLVNVSWIIELFLLSVSGAPLVLDFFQGWAPLVLLNTVASFSFLTHFSAITAGVIDLRDVIYFFTLIALFLCVNIVVIDLKRVTR